MRFASLGSGSRGNAAIIKTDQACVMVDCGLTVKRVRQQLEELSLTLDDIDALLLTHEHTDHASGAAALSRQAKIPVYMTHGTARHHSVQRVENIEYIEGFQSFYLADLHVQPVPVPHDANEPCQFIFSTDRFRLGVLTDTGSITSHICDVYDRCDALILECNHDVTMLRDGSYPASLKRRVGGQLGHLNNQQAVELLSAVDCERLQHLVVAHISQQNNSQEHVLSALREVFAYEERIVIADQDAGFDWLELV